MYVSEISEHETKVSQTTNQMENNDPHCVAEEIKRLEVLENDLEHDLQELELVSWEDKLALEKQCHSTILTELHAMRAKLKACESELKDNQEELSVLSASVDKESTKHEQDTKNAEIKLEKEIAELKRQIEDKLAENKEQEKKIGELIEESKRLDESFSEKSREEELLEKELKEANLQEFKTSEEAPDDKGKCCLFLFNFSYLNGLL